jgi:peptidoglycan/LPS O-acetylase OafA/YrhL
VLYVQNAFAQHNLADYFGVAWSLSVEEWFYVTFPLCLLLSGRAVGRSDLPFCIVFGLFFVLVVSSARTLFGDFNDWDASVRRVTALRLDSIAAGFLLYLAIDRVSHFASRYQGLLRIGASLSCIAFAFFGFSITYLAVTAGQLISEFLFPLSAAAFAASMIFLFYLLRGYFDTSPLIRFVCLHCGRISYSVYLFHFLMIVLLRPHIDDIALIFQLTLYTSCLIIFCSLFYHYFERPILAARPRYGVVSDRQIYIGSARHVAA